MYRNILKIITVFFVMLALIVPVTLEKLPAINEKYDMAKALEDNVLQNYVRLPQMQSRRRTLMRYCRRKPALRMI